MEIKNLLLHLDHSDGCSNRLDTAFALAHEHNTGITGLFVVGVYSNECVSTAIRDACDLGFYVTLISDGCATVTPELQRATMITMKDRYARVLNTEEAIEEIQAVVHT